MRLGVFFENPRKQPDAKVLTLGLPLFFYPVIYQGVENDTKALKATERKQCWIFYIPHKSIHTDYAFNKFGVEVNALPYNT